MHAGSITCGRSRLRSLGYQRYFKYESDYNFDRQEVLNRSGLQPSAGHATTAFADFCGGEIYRYQLVGTGQSL
jgi:hypothetical protein